ncbi:hypothetical protein [Photobacterium ganghwense]|uniref:hypothetical protein n=1 Tax=Photobacterium ganghwense TaxID=320778 RepID=UPI001C2CE607|nr:hypothetical protein [Photobacterium ganghwense]MBV1839078.1 hypothetical protein [Photobacterium ganghwense]
MAMKFGPIELIGGEFAGSSQLIIYRGFSGIRIYSDVAVLGFDTLSQYDSFPRGSQWNGFSEVTARASDVEKASDDHYELLQDKEAKIRFHVPNPLSPRAAGYWISLKLVRTNLGYKLRFDNLSGMIYYQSRFGWQSKSFRIGIGNFPTIDDWLQSLLPGLRVGSYVAKNPLFYGNDEERITKPRNISLRSPKFYVKPLPAEVPESLGLSHNLTSYRFGSGFLAKAVHNEVNPVALRISSLDGLRSKSIVNNRPLHLLCVAQATDMRMGATRFALDWLDIKFFDQDGFCIRALWETYTRHYGLGLSSTSSRNFLTFVPQRITHMPESNDDWVLRFDILQTNKQIRPRFVGFARQAPANLKIEWLGLRTTIGRAVEQEVTALVRQDPLAKQKAEDKVWLLDLEIQSSMQPMGELLLNGILFSLSELNSGSQIKIALRESLLYHNQPALDVQIKLCAASSRPVPVTEEPEETIATNAPLQRERSMVWDLSDAASDILLMELFESVNGESSREVKAHLRGSSFVTDVVLLDVNPFKVFRIQAESKGAQDELLAIFHDDGDNPPTWSFRTDTGEFVLIQPPQAIGEEMIKGRLTVERGGQRIPVPLKGELFDFRLSPPGVLVLDRNDVEPTQRADAPWSLRRLLTRRTGKIGLGIVKAQYELFYGMTASFRREGELQPRVAERLDSLGYIPFTQSLVQLHNADDPPSKEVQDYTHACAQWIGATFYRASELTVFTQNVRARFASGNIVKYYPRFQRQTADPLNPTNWRRNFDEGTLTAEHSYIPDKDRNRLPLRGGFDYGFQSNNIYEAVLSNKDRPLGTVDDLCFGPLGGTGTQQAQFDEGRSLIITRTEQGRILSISIVRTGRISMLWHHARHVIVYERTTRTASRYKHEGIQNGHADFDSQSDGFEGLAALRKVKEYVEITQPQRSYPETGDGTRKTNAGPLVGATFETTTIPVKSSWGRDIEDGMVIALRGPLKGEEKPFYPFPNIFLEMARAESKTQGWVNQKVMNPENIHFYTSTKVGAGSNTDLWPARGDVDFPVVSRPKPPNLSYLPAVSNSKHQPSAQLHDFGQKRFTIRVSRAEEGANLMHGRSGDGLEAYIEGVSLARGAPPRQVSSGTLESKLGSDLGEVQAQIYDGIAELAQQLRGTAKSIPGGVLGDVDGLSTELQNLQKQTNKALQKLQNRLVEQKSGIHSLRKTWITEQAESLEHARAAWAHYRSNGWINELEHVIGDIAAKLKLSGTPTDDELNEAKSLLASAFGVARTETLEQFDHFPFVPNEAFESLERTFESLDLRTKSWLGESTAELSGLIDKFERDWRPSAASGMRLTLVETAERLAGETDKLAVSIANDLGDALGWLFADTTIPGSNNGPKDLIIKTINDFTDDVSDWMWLTVDESIVPFEYQAPDWDHLRTQLNLSNEFEDRLNAEFEELRVELVSAFGKILDNYRTAVDTKLNDIKDLYQNLLTSPDGLLKLIDGNLTDFEDKAKDLLNKLQSDLDGHIETLANNLDPTETKSLFIDVKNALSQNNHLKQLVAGPIALDQQVNHQLAELQNLKKLLDNPPASLDNLAGQASLVAEQIGSGLKHIGDVIEGAIIREVGQQEGVFEGLTEGSLDLVRCLASGPITDTLETSRELMGYYYKVGQDLLNVTNATALFNGVGADTLNALSTQLPFDRIRDRLLPNLADFNLNDLLPDFAGLKLTHLFEGIQIPNDPLKEYDWIQLNHGFDRKRLNAWSEVLIDKPFSQDMVVFDLSPLALSVRNARLKGESKILVRQNTSSQNTSAQLRADWLVQLGGEPVLTFADATLRHDSRGGFGFDFKPQDLVLAPPLEFITDALSAFFPQENGVLISPVAPGGIKAELSLPIPDIGIGAFTMTGITLYSHFQLNVSSGFEVATGLWLSRPERPFGLAILFLGGGGWFGVDVRYRPPKVFETRVSVGVSAGAMVALNFGVARGSAGVLFKVGIDFYRNWSGNNKGEYVLSVGLIVWGEFSILAIASAYLRLTMRIEYRNGSMTGYGRVSVKIKICWCFTLRVNKQVTMQLAGSSRISSAVVTTRPATVNEAVSADVANMDW